MAFSKRQCVRLERKILAAIRSKKRGATRKELSELFFAEADIRTVTQSLVDRGHITATFTIDRVNALARSDELQEAVLKVVRNAPGKRCHPRCVVARLRQATAEEVMDAVREVILKCWLGLTADWKLSSKPGKTVLRRGRIAAAP